MISPEMYDQDQDLLELLGGNYLELVWGAILQL